MVDLLISQLAEGAAPTLVWGLIPRIVGALFAIAFASLAGQVLGLVGSRGISPARAQLDAMRTHFPGVLRFVRLPTLLWLNCSDRAIWLLPRLGILSGMYAIYGGPGSLLALGLCWLIYLSLDVCCLMYPWDCLLLEAGFLTLFLPEVPALPVLETSTLPLPIAAFALRFLLIRLMWGFAKFKFIGTQPGDDLYLRGFLVWTALCTPLGLRFQRAPAWVLRTSYAFMWLVEVICPGLAFFRGLPRMIAAIGLSSLMVGIGAMGNWGHFNIAYASLCIALLDTQSSLFDTTLEMVRTAPVTHALLTILLFGSLLYFATNSWVTQTFIHWPFEQFTWKRPWLRGLIGFYRALAPWRLIHGYGVFPPNSTPPIKVLPVFEGSDDGVNFAAYGYRYMPTRANSRSSFVAPHHPRIDHMTVYAGAGMTDSDYLASMVGGGKVFGFSSFSHYSWLDRLAQRLLEGEPSVLVLLGHNPFPERPPRFVRVSLRAFSPAETPNTWNVRHLGVPFAARQLDPLTWESWLPPPELFHPDFVHWRKKSPALAAMVREHQAGKPDAVLVHSTLTSDERERFWLDFVPAIADVRADFERMDALARELEAHYGKAQLLRFEQLAERYVYLLRLRLEPHLYGDAQPKLESCWNFRFHLLLHEFILDGRDAYEAMLREPARAVERASQVSDRSLLTFCTVMRNTALRFHGRAMRYTRCAANMVEPTIAGFLEFQQLVAEPTPPDEDWLPLCTREKNGVWHCPDFIQVE